MGVGWGSGMGNVAGMNRFGWDADIERRAEEAARLLGQCNSGDLYPEWKLQTLRCLPRGPPRDHPHRGTTPTG